MKQQRWERERGEAWRVSRQHSNRKRKGNNAWKRRKKSSRCVLIQNNNIFTIFSERERLWGHRVVHKMAQRDPLISSEWIDKTPLTDVPSYLSRKRLFSFSFFAFRGGKNKMDSLNIWGCIRILLLLYYLLLEERITRRIGPPKQPKRKFDIVANKSEPSFFFFNPHAANFLPSPSAHIYFYIYLLLYQGIFFFSLFIFARILSGKKSRGERPKYTRRR